MWVFLAFALGVFVGDRVDTKIDAYKSAKIANLEKLLELDEDGEYIYHQDAFGQVWKISPSGYCEQVF